MLAPWHSCEANRYMALLMTTMADRMELELEAKSSFTREIKPSGNPEFVPRIHAEQIRHAKLPYVHVSIPLGYLTSLQASFRYHCIRYLSPGDFAYVCIPFPFLLLRPGKISHRTSLQLFILIGR